MASMASTASRATESRTEVTMASSLGKIVRVDPSQIMDQISLAPSTAALASLVKIMDCIKVGTVKLATRIDQIEGIIAPSLVIGTVAWACMVTAVQMMVA